jgi:hypothetical protein
MFSTTNAISPASVPSVLNCCHVDSSFRAAPNIVSVNNTGVTYPDSNFPDIVSEEMAGEIKVPEIAHFAWEGKGIPETHLSNILNFRRLNPEFETKIWTTCPGTINRTLEKMLIGDDAKYRYLAFNYSDKKEDGRFLKTEDPRSLFLALPQGIYAAWAREHGGSFANQAAASDVTRLAALYHYGGTYFDVDVSMTKKFNNPVYYSHKKSTCGILTYGNPVITAIKNSPAIAASLMTIDKNYRAMPGKMSDDCYRDEKLFAEDKRCLKSEDVWDVKRTTKRGRIFGSVTLTGIHVFKGGWWPGADPFSCGEIFGHNAQKSIFPANSPILASLRKKRSSEECREQIKYILSPLDDPLTRDWEKGVDGKAESYKYVAKLKSRRTSIGAISGS